MKIKNTSVFNQNNIHLNELKGKHKYQVLRTTGRKERNNAKNLSKFC